MAPCYFFNHTQAQDAIPCHPHSMLAALVKWGINTEFNQQLTFMHIHMEMGRVATMRRRESTTNSQPHRPMSESVFSKAGREDKHVHL